MPRRFQFNIQEYTSLRSEIVQRISVINAQSHTAILTIITAFGAGLTLNYNVQVNHIDNTIVFISLNIICSLIFLIPILYLLPLAVKSGENLIQLASLSAYIRVFYDYISEDNKKMNWETSNNILSNANVDRGKRSFYMKFCNEEYTVLATISFVLYILFSVISIIILKPVIELKYVIIIIMFYAILAFCLFGIIIFIHKSSGMKNTLMKYTPIYIEGYIKRAIQMGVIKDTDIEVVKTELNPYKEIEIGFWKK